jgi:poly-gamma-glutamate synthesis protein (capsule biosynthesis protein)
MKLLVMAIYFLFIFIHPYCFYPMDKNETQYKSPNRVVIAFTGDLMVHAEQLIAAYQRESDTYFFSSFCEVSKYLQEADYTIGNLETTFAGAEAGYGSYPLFNTPDAFADEIKTSGFDFVTTANNHCFDKNAAGLLRTLDVLDTHGIAHAGTYASPEDQSKLYIVELGGIKFALLSYTYGTNDFPVPTDMYWMVNILDETLMKNQIQQARTEADIVIVLPHMGDEYALIPAERYMRLAHRLCQWGADAVMVSHPHVLQPAEFYTVSNENGQTRECFIAYSMGNFISHQRTEPQDAGAIFYLSFIKTPEKILLYSVSCLPTWVKFDVDNNRYDIKVLSVYDALINSGSNKNTGLLPQDIERLKRVYQEAARLFLGKEKPLDEITPTFVIPKVK